MSQDDTYAEASDRMRTLNAALERARLDYLDASQRGEAWRVGMVKQMAEHALQRNIRLVETRRSELKAWLEQRDAIAERLSNGLHLDADERERLRADFDEVHDAIMRREAEDLAVMEEFVSQATLHMNRVQYDGIRQNVRRFRKVLNLVEQELADDYSLSTDERQHIEGLLGWMNEGIATGESAVAELEQAVRDADPRYDMPTLELEGPFSLSLTDGWNIVAPRDAIYN